MKSRPADAAGNIKHFNQKRFDTPKAVAGITLIIASLYLASCDWIDLAKNSWNYRKIQRGEAANIVVYSNIAYATIAEDGILIVEIPSGKKIGQIIPPGESGSADDVAIAGDLLFVLDARIPGNISVYSLANPAQPEIVSQPQPVPVEPFSGVSASDGLCIVSGGTSELTVWRFDSTGSLTGPIATSDFGRGQPDVLLDSSGIAYVSAHYWGPYFGIDIGRLDNATNEFQKSGSLELDGAGFTEGGAKPANFPIESALLNEDTLLVAFARGLALIDVSLPNAPKLIRVVDVGGKAVNVDVLDRTALVSVPGNEPHLAVVYFGKDTNVSIERINLDAGTIPAGVALTVDYAVIAALNQGVLFHKRKHQTYIQEEKK